VSLLRGHRAGRAFREVFGSRRIEDLAQPYFCVSTNLTRAEEVEHRRGPLARAVRASVSLPGVLPPVAERGDLLVDGGLLNNMPVDSMNRLTGGGPVVAVDVSPDVDLRAEIDAGTEVSGWRVLWSRISPFSERIVAPSILSVLGRSVVVGSILSQRQRLATGDTELYLLLPVGDWGLLEFRAIDQIVQRGFEASLEPLRSWWAAFDRGTAECEVHGNERL
jgi:NTE family protein/lysophospholipid hydrolase